MPKPFSVMTCGAVLCCGISIGAGNYSAAWAWAVCASGYYWAGVYRDEAMKGQQA